MSKKIKAPKLGDLARDVVSGFEGIVIGKTKWLTNCDTYVLSPPTLNKDGEPRKSEHFDIDRVEIVQRGMVRLAGGKAIKEARKTGGPSSLDSFPDR